MKLTNPLLGNYQKRLLFKSAHKLLNFYELTYTH